MRGAVVGQSVGKTSGAKVGASMQGRSKGLGRNRINRISNSDDTREKDANG